jgi:hypothetical protein
MYSKSFAIVVIMLLIAAAGFLWEYRNSTWLGPFLGANTRDHPQLVHETTPGQEGWQSFASSSMGVSIKYPQGYTINNDYVYQNLGPHQSIPGIKVTIASSTAEGTNLSSFDTGVSVEHLTATTTSFQCSADLFLAGAPHAQDISDRGIDYSVASTTGAGAGNRYEETVYAIPGTNPCIAVRYFIHYGVLQNYPKGSVQAFNRETLIKDFDGIRYSLVLSK